MSKTYFYSDFHGCHEVVIAHDDRPGHVVVTFPDGSVQPVERADLYSTAARSEARYRDVLEKTKATLTADRDRLNERLEALSVRRLVAINFPDSMSIGDLYFYATPDAVYQVAVREVYADKPGHSLVYRPDEPDVVWTVRACDLFPTAEEADIHYVKQLDRHLYELDKTIQKKEMFKTGRPDREVAYAEISALKKAKSAVAARIAKVRGT